jgi:hypothetical protein
MSTLYESVAQYRADLEALADLDLDPQTYADTVESMGGDLESKLRAVIAYSLELDIEATGAAAASKRMKERADSLSRKHDWLQRYALDAMQATGIGTVETDEFCAKIAKTPGRVVIADGAELPIEYLRVKTISEPDKTALKDAIAAGAEIPCVSLVSGYRLSIR